MLEINEYCVEERFAIFNVQEKEGKVVVNFAYWLYDYSWCSCGYVIASRDAEAVLDVKNAADYICSDFNELNNEQKKIVADYIAYNVDCGNVYYELWQEVRAEYGEGVK